MSSASNSANQAKPSQKMLRYLRYLAERSGTSFSYPHTAAEASREIGRLQGLKADSRRDIERERRGVQVDMATRRGDAAAICDEELTGYGSSATWARGPEREPTEKQIDYLRYLAIEAGESFSEPYTFTEASKEIECLMAQLGISASSAGGSEREPTEKQIGYLRYLAIEAGEGFNQSETSAEAGKEIERLLAQIKNNASTAPRTPKARPASGPRVVHCKREHFDVYVGRGRGSIWGNPFREGRDGTREQVIAKYERWLLDQPELMARLPELRGKTLGCWCAPMPCHADVLLRLANTCPSTAVEDGRKGKPHALAGYTVGGEHRLIVVQRIDGLIRVGDLPANGKGKRYLIADELRTCGELDELLIDYNQQIARLRAIPAQRVAVDELLELVL